MNGFCAVCAASGRKSVTSLSLFQRWSFQLRYYAKNSSASIPYKAFPPEKIRNIGIIAHIDAGKTTTTERMLYCAGYTKRIGDVDDGDTVMDYLPAERERGITITAAAITFPWRDHRVNLIDTPGHVDFTIEVERSVRVLDGAVTILDGVAGVEAQTETVWHQATKFNIPKIIYINKMDRIGASFSRTVREIYSKLKALPLVVQVPIRDKDGEGIEGIVDLLTLEKLTWKGVIMTRKELSDKDDWLLQIAKDGRSALVERLSDFDEKLVDVFLSVEDPLKVPREDLITALRKVTLSGEAVPVYCGASLRDLGVQPILDAIIDYLPSPADRPPPSTFLATTSSAEKNVPQIELSSSAPLCALAFKVVHDERRGLLVFVRIYSGTLTSRMTLYNTCTRLTERANKLVKMYADEVEDVQSFSAGDIGVIVGLKETRTGDTLVAQHGSGKDAHQLQLQNIDIPPAVFFVSIEALSTSVEPELENALNILLREDPSLHLRVDEESGQTLLSGMGELHLEIVRDRLASDFDLDKDKIRIGPMRISYREALVAEDKVTVHHSVTRDIAQNGGCVSASISISLDRIEGNNRINIKGPIGRSDGPLKDALYNGAVAALSRGPILGYGITNTHITIENVTCSSNEMTPAVLSVVSQCLLHTVNEAYSKTAFRLMEPYATVEIKNVPDHRLGHVLSELSGKRRARVIDMDSPLSDESGLEVSNLPNFWLPPEIEGATGRRQASDNVVKRTIRVEMPLAHVRDLSTALRSVTGGEINGFGMVVEKWDLMDSESEHAAIQEIRGSW